MTRTRPTLLGRLVARLHRSSRSCGPAPGDRGAAMVTVLGTVMVLTLLVGGTLAYAAAGQSSARGGQDWNAALAAAEAGVDDYTARLNDQPAYWRYGNPAAPFSAGSSVALPTPANRAFTEWVTVPGSDGRARFRYEVDTRQFPTSGVVRLQSTGAVGREVRTVQVTLDQRGFLDYLYFTDYETKDPDAYTGNGEYTPEQARANCMKHFYEGRQDRVGSDARPTPTPDPPPGCSVIRFVSGDELWGPMHSNDAVYVCGQPDLNEGATTSYDGSLTDGRHYLVQSGCTNTWPEDETGTQIDLGLEPHLALPPSNTALAVQTDVTATDGQPGCLYTGPTKIVLRPDGLMDVTSPWSRNGGAAWCGVGAGRPLPARGVVWVRDVPAVADAYSQAAPTSPCTAGGNPVGYPVAEDLTSYGCRSGDVFVQGALQGRLTVGAANDIVITDDLTYAAAGCTATPSCQSVLGLVANNYVEIYHPVRCFEKDGGCDVVGHMYGVRVEAAILAVNHSFRVQNFWAGDSKGDLHVRGAIGQKFRGVVGQGIAGYSKDYRYDARLRTVSPPYFLDPVQSAFAVRTWSEQTSAHPLP
ncbi:hypothetical protein [Quadrisphaera sp. DSM 44207]|uniref:hypothetical protein n=1 Tax=Quadrisphaera sp. DSM 44207 TaxID=1881057 RepID=UPI000888E357|nr:hypothetical protein [Quadrisphaera sp. DSM 44207]SDQ46728.1 hypothetical protein SAMN05428996_1818 [Quadrisphaera sp. DSM 44207]